mgnify:CR=1 FL=1
MLKNQIAKLNQRKNLSSHEMENAISELLESTDEKLQAEFLTALHAKGETCDEIYGAVIALQQKMLQIDCPFPVLDIVGTGGDQANTVNISTGAAILAATCGIKMIKHGNRAVTSLCGSADVLEVLGVDISMDPTQIIKSTDQSNFSFCYAPQYHPLLAKIKEVRKKITTPTVFNKIGPLLNPALAKFLMIGVADPKDMDCVAYILLKLKVKHAWVFHCCGLDEICCAGYINVIEVKDSAITKFLLDPRHYGLSHCMPTALQGGSPKLNAKLLTQSLQGEKNAVSDSLILNAAIACYIYGVCTTIEEGIKLATIQQQSGAGVTLLNKLKNSSQNKGR